MPPADAGAEVGRKPTAAADASAAGTGVADEVGRWGCGGTPSGTWEEQCRQSYHNLPPLCFLVGVDRLIHDDDITDKLWE
jgi:hypothetical protein